MAHPPKTAVRTARGRASEPSPDRLQPATGAERHYEATQEIDQ